MRLAIRIGTNYIYTLYFIYYYVKRANNFYTFEVFFPKTLKKHEIYGPPITFR